MARAARLVATAVIIAASPLTTWWLVGDLSESADAEDYIFKAPELTNAQQLAIGLAATVLLVASAAAIVASLRQRRLTWVEVRPAIPLLLVGVFCGFAWRVVTARVGGANIGGGILLLSAPFFLIAMITWSWVLARKSEGSSGKGSPS